VTEELFAEVMYSMSWGILLYFLANIYEGIKIVCSLFFFDNMAYEKDCKMDNNELQAVVL